ncbi:MAG: ribose-phosphate diphosphokinase, partial [Syntrophobacterales bacterium]
LFAAPVLLEYIRQYFNNDLVIVSPDAGGVERARAFAKRLDATLAIIDKRRDEGQQVKAMHIIGEVEDKPAIILDDMVDTGGTLTEAAKALAENGARSINACCTHAVLSGSAIERIEESAIENLIVTDSIPLKPEVQESKKIKVLTVAKLLGEAIKRTHLNDSVSSLFV